MPNIEAVWNDIISDIQPVNNDINLTRLTRTYAFNVVKLEACKQSQNETCSICLEPFCDGRLKCKHYFHDICIKKWLKSNVSCPYCRNSNVCLVPP